MRDHQVALPNKQFRPAEPLGGAPSLWRRLACATRGHALEPDMPHAPLRCLRCYRVWSWEDLFRRSAPRGRGRSQHAYDDRYPSQTADVPAQYL